MILKEINPEFIPGARIKVIGTGGAGCNAINRMIQEWLEGVEFITVNTDAQALGHSLVPENKRINIWLTLTKGLGAGGSPDIGRKAAEEDEDKIRLLLQDTDMIFITTGMGWGTWTGATPVIAQIAKEMGILTIWVVTRPFSFEGKKRAEYAADGLAKLRQSVDSLIVIPNDKVLNVSDKKTTVKQAFAMIDRILTQGVRGITDLIIKAGQLNVDFNDIKSVMSNSGNALLGIGYGEGENRAVDATRRAIENPLLETNLDGAKGVIFNITGGDDLTVFEVQEAAKIVEDIIDPDCNFKWGMSIDENFNNDEVKVTIVATGFQEQAKEKARKAPSDVFRSNITKSEGKMGFDTTPRGRTTRNEEVEQTNSQDIDWELPPTTKSFNTKRLVS